VSVRRTWIEREATLAVSRQCALCGVVRSGVYAQRGEEAPDALELRLLELIDEQYTQRPFYGSRRMVVHLREQGYALNRKRVQRLMRTLGLAGMAPGPATSRPHPGHKVYPYLLRGVAIVRPDQVWSTDITYVRLAHGFAYLVAVMDWYSRRVLAWRLSNSLEAGFCVDCLEEALRAHGQPAIFNSDQGVQFTSEAFTRVLLDRGIAISMDGRGRALDNIFVERLWRTVKYEDIYLKGYASLPELLLGLTEYFAFYNDERPHQALGYCTPEAVYRLGEGGGASIAYDGGSAAGPSPAPLRSAGDGPAAEQGQRQGAACDQTGTA
jgi:putative transposase